MNGKTLIMFISDEGFEQEAVSSEKPSSRFLINYPSLGWRVFPTYKAIAVYHGDRPLSELAGQTIQVALAHVMVSRGTVVSLLRLQVSELTIGSNGYVDEDDLQSRIRAILDLGISATPESPIHGQGVLSDNEIRAIQLALGCC